MKFSDVLTSVMNGVRVRRAAWPKEKSVRTHLSDAGSGKDVPFTTEDAQADDWVILVPKPGRLRSSNTK